MHRRFGAVDDFRRHIERRADRGDLCFVRDAIQRRAKIGQLDIAAGLVKNISRLYIAMNQPLRIGKAQRTHAFENDFGDDQGIEQFVGFAILFERTAFDIFHDDVAHALIDDGVVNPDDVRVHDLARERGFIQEHALVKRAVFGVLQHFRKHDLDRDIAIVEGVLGHVNRAGCAAPEFAQDAIFTDGVWCTIAIRHISLSMRWEPLQVGQTSSRVAEVQPIRAAASI